MTNSRYLVLIIFTIFILAPTYSNKSWEKVAISENPIQRQASESVAMIVLDKGLTPELSQETQTVLSYNIELSALRTKSTDFCEDEPFAQVKRAKFGRSSAVLVSEDHVLTAAHSIDDNKVKERSFVFGFNGESDKLKYDQVYKGEIVERIYQDGLDFVILKLDRPVNGFKPANWRDTKNLAMNQKVNLIGHPLGLPAMHSFGHVKAIDPSFGTSTDVNCASGMSGAGYFNDKGILIGIHLGGDPPSTISDKSGDIECLRWTVQNQNDYNFAILTDTNRGKNTLIGGCAYLEMSKIKPYLEKYLNSKVPESQIPKQEKIN